MVTDCQTGGCLGRAQFCTAAAGAFSRLQALPLHPTRGVVSSPANLAAACSRPALSSRTHRMSLSSWVQAGPRQPRVTPGATAERGWGSSGGEGTRAWRGDMGMEMGHGHREMMWARRGDVAVILTWRNGPAEREGGPRSLLPRPRVRSVCDHGVPRRCWVISGIQHWACLGGTAQGNTCQEWHECSALPGILPRPCQPSPWWGSIGQVEPSCPSPWGLLGQATPSAPAPMNHDRMNHPGGSCTDQEEQAHGPRGLSYPAEGPPSSAGWTCHSLPQGLRGMGTLLSHPLTLPGVP